MPQKDNGAHFGDTGENDHYGGPMHEDHADDRRTGPDQSGEDLPADTRDEHEPDRSGSGFNRDRSLLKATGIHLSGMVGFYFTTIILANILAPLILWVIWKGGSECIEKHGTEALNFQISMTLYTILSIPFLLICMIGVIPILLVALAEIILPIIAAIYAWNGEPYSYPMTIRFVG
jgi:uncharacterized Tic20 family protein